MYVGLSFHRTYIVKDNAVGHLTWSTVNYNPKLKNFLIMAFLNSAEKENNPNQYENLQQKGPLWGQPSVSACGCAHAWECKACLLYTSPSPRD